jgi:hypothetical protein
MIAHQAVGKQRELVTAEAMPHQIEECQPVLVLEEDGLSVIPALDCVVRPVRKHNASKACHRLIMFPKSVVFSGKMGT